MHKKERKLENVGNYVTSKPTLSPKLLVMWHPVCYATCLQMLKPLYADSHMPQAVDQ